jgi:hypothetical protein
MTKPEQIHRLSFVIEEFDGRVVAREPDGDVEGHGLTIHDAMIDLIRSHAHQQGVATGEEIATDGGES